MLEVAQTLPEDLTPAIHELRLAELWERLLVTGGYPDAWLAEDPQPTLHHLVEAFVLKDTSDLHTIERPLVFRRLLELAASDIGNLVNISNWASLAQASRTAVSRYLAIAEEAHILHLLPPFAGGLRAEVKGSTQGLFPRQWAAQHDLRRFSERPLAALTRALFGRTLSSAS